ncbi:MAG: hypothetical protein U0521_12490 [Anaerolineae bacterium]
MTADSRTNRVRSLILFLSKIEGLPIALVLVAVFAVFIITAPTVFLKPGIYMSFFETVPPMVICGLGLTLVITAGEIDLSFPAVVALSGLALAWSYRNLDPVWGPWVGVVLALAAGALVGYINGLMVPGSAFRRSWRLWQRSCSGTASRSCWRAGFRSRSLEFKTISCMNCSWVSYSKVRRLADNTFRGCRFKPCG